MGKLWPAGHTIAAGAGPIGGKFSPTRLTAWLVPTNPGGTLTDVAWVPTACRINCSNQGEIYAFHIGGANVCMGDGSVRFMSNSTDLNVHRGLGTRADGLPIGGTP